MLIVLTTVETAEAGERLGERIVGEGLAACVQVLPPMTSIYVWEGEVKRESEHLLLIKTVPGKWSVLRDFIEANHPYSVPEIVAVESSYASDGYAAWVAETVRG